jgi:hypothetical protein
MKDAYWMTTLNEHNTLKEMIANKEDTGSFVNVNGATIMFKAIVPGKVYKYFKEGKEDESRIIYVVMAPSHTEHARPVGEDGERKRSSGTFKRNSVKKGSSSHKSRKSRKSRKSLKPRKTKSRKSRKSRR